MNKITLTYSQIEDLLHNYMMDEYNYSFYHYISKVAYTEFKSPLDVLRHIIKKYFNTVLAVEETYPQQELKFNTEMFNLYFDTYEDMVAFKLMAY